MWRSTAETKAPPTADRHETWVLGSSTNVPRSMSVMMPTLQTTPSTWIRPARASTEAIHRPTWLSTTNNSAMPSGPTVSTVQ